MKISTKKLLDLYVKMLRINLVEESFVQPIIDGLIKTPAHLCVGQEAVAVGLCSQLKSSDYIYGNHRSHGHYLAKGGDLTKMISEIYCRETGCAKGRGGSMHLIDVSVGVMGIVPIVGGTISLATGTALASKVRNDGNVTVSFFGDGATGEGVLYESLNFAALNKLPIIYVCENNLYSTHLPLDEIRADIDIYKSAIPFGVKSHQIDGNDVKKVYEISNKLIEACRRGDGPFFIEFLTYRTRGHVGPDDNIQGTHTDIRSENEIKKWKNKNPIKLLEQELFSNNILNKNLKEEILKNINKEIEDATNFALKSNFPNPNELMNYVFK